jgi:diazepam-binding inhibitor (GABA receptor modulating acyl-CoA-binding protein)
MAGPASTGNAAFIKAAEDAKSLPNRPDNETMLERYALFKQGIVGDNDTEKPGLLNLTAKAKWEAWNGRKGPSKETAQQQHIDLVTKLQNA